MLYGLAYSEAAASYLNNVIPNHYRAQIRKRIAALVNNPHPNGAKKLQGISDGGNPIYRLRCGDYRVLYCLRPGPLVVVLGIGNRKDVYRRRG